MAQDYRAGYSQNFSLAGSIPSGQGTVWKIVEHPWIFLHSSAWYWLHTGIVFNRSLIFAITWHIIPSLHCPNNDHYNNNPLRFLHLQPQRNRLPLFEGPPKNLKRIIVNPSEADPDLIRYQDHHHLMGDDHVLPMLPVRFYSDAVGHSVCSSFEPWYRVVDLHTDISGEEGCDPSKWGDLGCIEID